MKGEERRGKGTQLQLLVKAPSTDLSIDRWQHQASRLYPSTGGRKEEEGAKIFSFSFEWGQSSHVMRASIILGIFPFKVILSWEGTKSSLKRGGNVELGESIRRRRSWGFPSIERARSYIDHGVERESREVALRQTGKGREGRAGTREESASIPKISLTR